VCVRRSSCWLTHISASQLQALYANNSQKTEKGKHAALNMRNMLALDKYCTIVLKNSALPNIFDNSSPALAPGCLHTVPATLPGLSPGPCGMAFLFCSLSHRSHRKEGSILDKEG